VLAGPVEGVTRADVNPVCRSSALAPGTHARKKHTRHTVTTVRVLLHRIKTTFWNGIGVSKALLRHYFLILRKLNAIILTYRFKLKTKRTDPSNV
jgi:hypothetical protein